LVSFFTEIKKHSQRVISREAAFCGDAITVKYFNMEDLKRSLHKEIDKLVKTN
jgi:hypothetical protein